MIYYTVVVDTLLWCPSICHLEAKLILDEVCDDPILIYGLIPDRYLIWTPASCEILLRLARCVNGANRSFPESFRPPRVELQKRSDTLANPRNSRRRHSQRATTQCVTDGGELAS